MNSVSTKKLVLNGLMIALVFLTTYFTRIPGPIYPGYINFGDILIMVAAILLGRGTGLASGAIGSAIADIAAGGMIFAPITFVVKGLEGYIAGVIADSAEKNAHGEARRLAAVVISAAVMVAGYFIAEWLLLPFVDKTFGYTAAIAELVPNLVQGGVSAVAAYVLVSLLDRVGVRKVLN